MVDNRQRYVTGDTMCLVAVVAGRDIKTICGRAMNQQIEPTYGSRETAFITSLPEVARNNLILCRRLHARFLHGDYRMSQPEHDRLIEATDWLQRLDRRTKHQADKPPIQWQRDNVFQETSLPPETYEELLVKVAIGDIDKAVTE